MSRSRTASACTSSPGPAASRSGAAASAIRSTAAWWPRRSAAPATSQITVEDCLIHHNNGGYKEGAPGVATYHEGLTMENVDGFVIRRTQVYDNYMEGRELQTRRPQRRDRILRSVLQRPDQSVHRRRVEHRDPLQPDLRVHLQRGHRIRPGNQHVLTTTRSASTTTCSGAIPAAISFWAGAVVAQTRNISIDNNTFYNNEFGVRWKSSAADNYGGANFIRNNLFWPHHARWAAIRDQTAGRQALGKTTVAYKRFKRAPQRMRRAME